MSAVELQNGPVSGLGTDPGAESEITCPIHGFFARGRITFPPPVTVKGRSFLASMFTVSNETLLHPILQPVSTAMLVAPAYSNGKTSGIWGQIYGTYMVERNIRYVSAEELYTEET